MIGPIDFPRGAVVRSTLPDGKIHYGRLLGGGWAAFYDLRTDQPLDRPEEIVGHPVLFTVFVNRNLLEPGFWEVIDVVPLEASLRPPDQFRQDITDPYGCLIVSPNGDTRRATIEECEGLEREAVWDPIHVQARLRDHYAGRPNRSVASLQLVHPEDS